MLEPDQCKSVVCEGVFYTVQEKEGLVREAMLPEHLAQQQEALRRINHKWL